MFWGAGGNVRRVKDFRVFVQNEIFAMSVKRRYYVGVASVWIKWAEVLTRLPKPHLPKFQQNRLPAHKFANHSLNREQRNFNLYKFTTEIKMKTVFGIL